MLPDVVFSQGPALTDDFWLLMVTWHVGLFVALTLGQASSLGPDAIAGVAVCLQLHAVLWLRGGASNQAVSHL